MRLILVRHGHPDYKNDCLTALGRKQAAAAAIRLKDEGITEIHASTCGRAMETAEATASLLSLPIRPQPFMREIAWGPREGQVLPCGGHPWNQTNEMVEKGIDLLAPGWEDTDYFRGAPVLESAAKVAAASDEWMASLGFRREGAYYRAVAPANRVVALFSHGGSSSALLARLTNLPFAYVCAAIRPDFTTVSVLRFCEDKDALVIPQIELLGDSRHIQGIE